MIVYLDSSVLLRVVLKQENRLEQWMSIRIGVTSALAEVECLRTLDRFRAEEKVSDVEIAHRREAIYRLLRSTEIVDISRTILQRAAQPLPTVLGTLDAIHLATAALWRERKSRDLILATHDRALGRAARSMGLKVIGTA